MGRAVIGMDPHKRSATIEVIDDEQRGTGECTAVCPKGIPLSTIVDLNRDFRRAVRSP